MCISNIVHMHPVATFVMAPFLFHARMFVKGTIYVESKTSSVTKVVSPCLKGLLELDCGQDVGYSNSSYVPCIKLIRHW